MTKSSPSSSRTATQIKIEMTDFEPRRALSAPISLALVIICSYCLSATAAGAASQARDYYYTRTRYHPESLRVSETLKNRYVDDVRHESIINGTRYEYYKSKRSMGHDELVFEIIDKMFQHRLSPFYIHHYDSDDDKRLSSDPARVSQEACARDLMYLVDKLPKFSAASPPDFRRGGRRKQDENGENNFMNYLNDDDENLSPELTAFFDSYARQEAGLMTGNTFWVGAYDQCVNRHVFDMIDARHSLARSAEREAAAPANNQRHQLSTDQDRQVVSFEGRYCVASLKAPSWDSIVSAKQAELRASNYYKSEQQYQDYSKLFRLQVGICLPSTCDSNSLDRHKDEIKLLTTSLLEARYEQYNLIDLYCLPDEKSPLRQWSSSALNFLAFGALWLSLVLLATLADVLEFVDTASGAKATSGGGGGGGDGTDKAKPSSSAAGARQSRVAKLVVWFSLRANYIKLMRVSDDETAPAKAKTAAPKRDGAGERDAAEQKKDQKEEAAGAQNTQTEQKNDELNVNLKFLNAFKVLIMFWIVNGHIMLLMIQTAKNILYSDALLNGLMHFLIGATFGVDLFFTMTGFLTAYLLFNSGHAYRMKAGTWLYLSFHRYWRLAPMYLLTFWFSRSVAQSLGSGPLWDYGTSAITFRGLCNTESWWYPLTLTSNLHGLFEECMITSWYISCDMQFWLVSPIFIHLLAKSPASGWLVSLATIFASSRVRYDAILSEKSARYDELVQPRADIFMRVSHDLPALYTHPHYRIAAYIVGLLAGHYVYMVKSGKWRSSLTGSGATGPAVGASAQDQATGEQVAAERKLGLTAGNGRHATRSLVGYSGLVMFLTMAFVSYLLAYYFPSSLLRFAKPVAAIAYSVDHLVMSIGASFVIIAMCFGQWPTIVRFLSHPNWTRLSKLNYALLLLQCEAIYYQIFRHDHVPVAGTKELINILFNLLVTLYPLAFAATLVFEYPLANIEKLLLAV